MKKRYVLFILIFILAVVFTAAMVGCNDKNNSGQDDPQQEVTEVRYSSMKGDVLLLKDDATFTLTFADGVTSYRGTYSGKGNALVLKTTEKDLIVSLDGGSFFSIVNIDDSPSVDPVKPAPACKHEYTEVKGYAAASCEKDGFSGNEVCLDCGAIVTPGAVMPAFGHNFKAESDVVCLKGYCTRNETHYHSCTVCGKVSSDPEDTYEVPNTASGQHSFTATSDRVYQEATCGRDRICYAACCVCGEIGSTVTLSVPGTATGNHDFSVESTKKMYSEPDCGHNARYYYECSVCGIVSINPADTYEVEGTATGEHSFTEPCGRVMTEATCVCDRVEYAACAVCGLVDESKGVSIPGTATGVHLFTALSEEVAQRATCTTDKYVYSQCKFCGLVNRDRVLRVIATVLNHTYIDHVCTDCGAADPNSYDTCDISADKNTDHVQAYLYRSGLEYDLLISGTGNAESYAASSKAPWAGVNVTRAFVYGNVDEIGDYTFADLPALASVKIVADVKRFGNYAFYGCNALEAVALPLSTERIGVAAFAHCGALRSVNLGQLSSLSFLGSNLFRGDTSLQSMDLSGAGITVLPRETFSECTVLQSVVLPSGLQTISDYAFSCTALGSISFPSGLKNIGIGAFADCTYLAGVDLSGTSIVGIGDRAFAGADLLSSFTLCGGVKKIGRDILAGTAYYRNATSWTGSLLYSETTNGKEYLLDALNEDTYLKVVANAGDNPSDEGWYKIAESNEFFPSTDVFCRGGAQYYKYLPDESKYVRVEGHVGDVPYGQWYEQRTEFVKATETTCGSTTTYYKKATPVVGSVTLPAVTKTIASAAMEDCVSVVALNLGGAQYVGEDAFRHCMSLTSVQIDSVKEIGEGAFYSCGKLTTVTLPATVLSVGGLAFAGCSSLRSFSYREGASISEDALDGNNLFEVYRPSNDADCFGAVVVHTNAYTARSTITTDADGFVFACNPDNEWELIGYLKPESKTVDLPDSFIYGDQTITSYRIHEKAFCYAGYYAQFVSVSISSAVTAIGKEAFARCGGLNELSVPLSVKEIGENALIETAFYNDANNWQDGFLYLKANDGDSYFLLTVRPVVGVRLSDAVVKEKTAVIADKTFALCSDMKTLTLPSTIVSVGKDLLTGCPQIASLTLPFVGKTSDPDEEGGFLSYLFGGESYADNAALPTSLTSLTVTNATVMPEYALYRCDGLKTIVLNKVSAYRDYSLYGCVNANVSALAEISSVGAYAFYDCIGLGAVSLANSLSSVGRYAFYHTGLRRITIPARTESIGEYAFSESPYLYNAVLGPQLTFLGVGAFKNCIGLIQVTVGEAMVETGANVGIQADAFYGCRKLVEVFNKSQNLSLNLNSAENGYLTRYAKQIIRTETATRIVERDDFCLADFGDGKYLLTYIGTASAISLPENYNATSPSYKIYPYAFAGNERIKKVVMSPAATEIGEYAFMDCSAMTEVTVSSSAYLIGKGAFTRSGLAGVSLPTSITAIGESAFEDCPDLTSVVFGAGVRTIGLYAFRNCTSLTAISLSASVETIGEEAFFGCSSARNLTVRQNVTSVGKRAFAECVMLNRIVWDSFIQPTSDSQLFENAGSNSFGITADFTSVAAIPDFFFDTGSVATAPKVVDVLIGSSVTKIGKYAFRNLEIGTTEIVLPASLSELGDFCFENSRIGSITLPDSVSVVGVGVFKDCAFLNTVMLSSGMTTIPMGMFEGCRAIVSVVLPRSVTTVSENAFLNCSAMQNVAVFNTLTAIGNNAFSGCTGLKNLFVLDGSTFTATVGTGNAPLTDPTTGAKKKFAYFENNVFSVYKDSNDQKNMLNFRNEDGGLYDPYAIEYESSDASIVSVAFSDGTLTGLAYGNAVITVKITLVSGLVAYLTYNVTVI